MEEFNRILQEGVDFLEYYYSDQRVDMLLRKRVMREIGSAILSYTVLRRLQKQRTRLVVDPIVVQRLSDWIKRLLETRMLTVGRQPLLRPFLLTYIAEAAGEFEDERYGHALLSKLLHDIAKCQNDDGSWSYFRKNQCEGRTIPTALVIEQMIAFLRSVHERGESNSKLSSLQESLDRAIGWLRHSQNSDGGWGFKNGDISRPITTAIATRALPSSTGRATNISKQWLVRHQKPNGSWDPSEEIVLSSGLQPIHLKWVSTPYAVAALFELGMSINHSPIHRAIGFFLKHRHVGIGGWGFTESSAVDPWHTAETIHELVRLVPFIEGFSQSYPVWTTVQKAGAFLTPSSALLALFSMLYFPELTKMLSVFAVGSFSAWIAPAIWFKSRLLG